MSKSSSEKPAYIMFDPMKDNIEDIKCITDSGIYLICFRDLLKLPVKLQKLEYSSFENYNVLYIGKSSRGFYKRDYKNHYCGLARNSKVRKSLGTLKGLNRKYYSDLKYRFIQLDEERLSLWMKENLIIFYLITNDFDSEEIEYINRYYPPLNIKDNRSVINAEFRKELKMMRTNHG